jgi:hypothetical protein
MAWKRSSVRLRYSPLRHSAAFGGFVFSKKLGLNILLSLTFGMVFESGLLGGTIAATLHFFTEKLILKGVNMMKKVSIMNFVGGALTGRSVAA